MEQIIFGRTGLEVSRLTFGCGAVGGLMTKGNATDQDRAVAWARDYGITFFDTAASYGNGASETNLGRALGGNTDGIIISTKVGLIESDLSDIAGAVRKSLDASLGRLGLDHVDIFQLHNTIGRDDGRGTFTAAQVLADVVPAFEQLRDAGKTRFVGFTAKGEPDELHALVESGCFDSAQIFYNLLVPSAGQPVATGYPSENYRELITAAKRHGVGTIGVRALAGGALSGSETRHPLGIPSVEPIGSETDYATDVRRAIVFAPLIDAGFAASLPELAIRYVISNPALSTMEIGIATLDELQGAATAIDKGPLAQEALDQISLIQSGFVQAPT
ncbi:MAG: aryl-alcohol dehydrogenase-like predicted oxidoreductase [Gammaproteobacteria bacterium]|jgi:aryl-alcohol dehydrogenase-like predicted oxidoreductase